MLTMLAEGALLQVNLPVLFPPVVVKADHQRVHILEKTKVERPFLADLELGNEGRIRVRNNRSGDNSGALAGSGRGVGNACRFLQAHTDVGKLPHLHLVG
jgi:hypothetical protein